MDRMEAKRAKRLEKKKRKIEAFLSIAQLNDTDKKKRKTEDLNENEVNENLVFKTNLEEDYSRVKQKYREHKQSHNCNPSFRLKSIGDDALLTRTKEERIPLYLSDLQALLTFCLAGDDAPCLPHRWCTLSNWKRLTNIVCLVIDGVGINEITENKSNKCSWITSNLGSDLLEIVSPASYGVSVPEELALVPTSKSMLEKLMNEYGSLESALAQLDRKGSVKSLFPTAPKSLQNPPEKSSEQSTEKEDVKTAEKEKDCVKLKLLLSAKQMLMEGYPLPVLRREPDTRQFVFTKDVFEEVHENSELYSVDCEMCLTADGHELTKICVVNEKMEVVYKTLVKPDNPIHNYLTRYSGVTATDLENVTTKLKDVQADLRALLPADCILVGQSLNFDLKAMKMMHPYVIDTACIYNITGDRRIKTKLSTLTTMFLERDIQTQGPDGHCPEEDAIAALQLTLLKIREGFHFGDVLVGGSVPGLDVGVEDSPDSKQKNLAVDIHITMKKEEVKRISTKKFKGVGVSVSKSLQNSYEKHPEFVAGGSFKTGDTAESVLDLGKQGALEFDLSITHIDMQTNTTDKVSIKTADMIYTKTEDKMSTKTTDKISTNTTDKMSTNNIDLMSKVDKMVEEMYMHTSINGLFVVLFGGGLGNNSVAAFKLVKAPL